MLLSMTNVVEKQKVLREMEIYETIVVCMEKNFLGAGKTDGEHWKLNHH